MKLLKNVKIKLTPLNVLFMSAISTLASGFWLLLVRHTVNKKALIGYASYYSDAVKEIAFCALLHIAVAFILYIDCRFSQGERR